MLFVPFFSLGQKDTTTFEEVTIKGNHFAIDQHTTLNESQIKQLAPHDLGTLLQYINGVTIKNYGGIGGMKTLSHRGLGGEHTQLVIDGIPINDPQNGQRNLANIQPNNLEEVKVSHQNESELVPVSSLIKGSAIHLKTFDQQFSPRLLSVRSSITIGSFGQKEAFVALKKGGRNNFLSLTGGMRNYEGNYPYQLEYGTDTKEVLRRNNALNDYHLSIGAGYKWRKNKTHQILKVSAKTSQIDQELPGAVILYNNMAQETLLTKNSDAGINYGLISKKFGLKAFAQYAHRFIHYHDPTYLNADGFMDNQYTTHSIIGGFHLRYSLNDFTFHVGNDFGYDLLKTSRNLGTPARYTNTSMFKAKYQMKYFYAEASVFAQVFIDENNMQDHRSDYHKLHPQLSVFTSDQLFSNIQFFAWYKPSSRAPSFNELYYSQVGNKTLKPEESSQLDLGFKYFKSVNKFEFQLQGNLFKNTVKEKILALPTQNLFVWSIQNIGEVDIFGGDIHVSSNYTINSDWNVKLQAGVSYQKAIDISDSSSPTFNHQIAYTPSLTGNATLSAAYKNLGLHATGLYIGERYSLNENILSNRLDPYMTFDISANYSFPIKNKHTLKLHTGIKNVANASYSFIRYYVMPGRSYFIKLSYEFN
jgi:outer membrane cobalamin receptor